MATKHKFTRASLVIIDWEDACGSEGGWTDMDALADRGLVPVRCVGWVVATGRGWVTLSAHITEYGQHGGDITIPTSNITGVEVLRNPYEL